MSSRDDINVRCSYPASGQPPDLTKLTRAQLEKMANERSLQIRSAGQNPCTKQSMAATLSNRKALLHDSGSESAAAVLFKTPPPSMPRAASDWPQPFASSHNVAKKKSCNPCKVRLVFDEHNMVKSEEREHAT